MNKIEELLKQVNEIDEKVITVSGDALALDPGLSPEQEKQMKASSAAFNKFMKFLEKHNGRRNIMKDPKLTKQLQKLEADADKKLSILMGKSESRLRSLLMNSGLDESVSSAQKKAIEELIDTVNDTLLDGFEWESEKDLADAQKYAVKYAIKQFK